MSMESVPEGSASGSGVGNSSKNCCNFIAVLPRAFDISPFFCKICCLLKVGVKAC